MKPNEKNAFRAKKTGFDGHFETEIRLFEPLDFIIHYHGAWKFAIRILKISQLVLVLLTKNHKKTQGKQFKAKHGTCIG